MERLEEETGGDAGALAASGGAVGRYLGNLVTDIRSTK